MGPIAASARHRAWSSSSPVSSTATPALLFLLSFSSSPALGWRWLTVVSVGQMGAVSPTWSTCLSAQGFPGTFMGRDPSLQREYNVGGLLGYWVNNRSCFPQFNNLQSKHLMGSEHCVQNQRRRLSCLCLPVSSLAEKKGTLMRKTYNHNLYIHKLHNNYTIIGTTLDICNRNMYYDVIREASIHLCTQGE